ncbi:MAG TPA: hypothetical protein VK623_00345 [Flavobacterium sp.]|nr:hypothetical protein [Flavobacterium sp.]
MERKILYTKDVQRFTGKSERASRDLLKKVRLHYNKQPEHAVTVYEFCEFLGISHDLFGDILK